jgi:hypothetical protein
LKRFLTVPAAILMVVVLIGACTSSDDTAEEPTTEVPAATVAPPETATTTEPATTTAATVTTTSPAGSSSDEFNEWYVGTWNAEGEIWHQQYSEDGTYRVGRSADGVESNPIEVGTYEFDGETLRIRAFDDSEYCAGIEAVYEAEFSESGTVVTHTLVTDDCGVRVEDQVSFRKLP